MKKSRVLDGLFRRNKQVLGNDNLVAQPKVDWGLLGTVIILTLFGLLMVYDASQFEAFRDFGNKYYYIGKQLQWVVPGIVALIVFGLIDYHYWQKFALPALLLSVLLLLLVFVPGLGVSAYGAHRWLGIAGFTVQPVEFIKLTSIVFLAALFQQKIQTRPFLLLAAVVNVIVGLFQKDLGSAIIFNIITFSIYFGAGAPLKYILGLAVAGVAGIAGFIIIAPYRVSRVLAFLDPFYDPQKSSYQISQVLIALGSGGWFGLGIGQSRQKFSYIPEVTTDSIFSIVGEELGFAGSLMLICLFVYLIRRCFSIAMSAPDNFGKLLGLGLTVWLGSQATVNLAAMVSLMPLTGVPLPFISYGGSALLTDLVAVGILLNISRFRS